MAWRDGAGGREHRAEGGSSAGFREMPSRLARQTCLPTGEEQRAICISEDEQESVGCLFLDVFFFSFTDTDQFC